jgi:signal transduction histidine kinase/CheY-like chemotaxis protein
VSKNRLRQFLKSHANAPRLGAIAVALCAIAVLWGGVAASLANVRSEAIAGATLNAENLARALDENVVRTVQSADQSLLSVRRSFSRDPTGFDIREWAQTTQAITELTPELAITDRNGLVVTGIDLPPGSQTDLSDRDYFQTLRNSATDALYIGKAGRGRVSGRTVMVLSRKVLAADGSFNGVVLLSLDAAYLSRFYRSMNLGRGGSVVLAGTDGAVRARGDELEADNPGPADAVQGQPAFYVAHRSTPAGSFIANSARDGTRRIFAYRQLAAYPLVVVVGIAEAEAQGRYRIIRSEAVIFGVAGSLLIAAVLRAHLLHARALIRVRDDLQARYTRKSGLLETTLEHISQGLMMVGADSRVHVFNQRLIDKLDLPREVLANEPLYEDVARVLWDRGEYQSEAGDFEAWARQSLAAESDAGLISTYEHTRPNGTVLEVRSRTLPGGGFVRTYTDITARKRDEQILRDARDEATRATRAKSAFLATMSHEIRSPLSGLLGVLELLRGTPLDAEQARMATMIDNSGRMLLAVLNDVLDFSKIEAGALSILPAPTDLRRLLENLVAPRGVEARQRGIAVTLAVAPGVPPWLNADALRVSQIVGNLLSNAMKFTEEGTISVTADIVPAASDAGAEGGEDLLRIAISDTGIGMDDLVVARLFQPFVQADGSTTRRYGGTGLGLCISQQLARLHGGSLSVSSTPGVGSTFTLDLPCRPCAPPAEPAAAVQAAPAPTGRPCEGARALLVDDDQTNRWLMRRQLQQLGFVVDIAEDGQAGLEAAQSASYDLVVTDLHMPGMDGVALTRAIRAADDAVLRVVPVIGLTADTTAVQRERCEQAGMTALAIKPLTGGPLAALVIRIIQAARGDAALT